MADTDVAERARRRQNRYWAIAFPLYILTQLVMALIIFFASGRDFGDATPALWLILALVSLFPLVVVGAALWGRRRGFGWLQPPLSLGVDRSRRKAMLAAIRANRPVAEDDVRIASDLARRLVRQRWIAWFFPAYAVFFIATRWPPDDFGVVDVLFIAFLVLELGVAPFVLRDARRARRWLADHGDTTAP